MHLGNKFQRIAAASILLTCANSVSAQGFDMLLKSLSAIQIPAQPAQSAQPARQSTGNAGSSASLTENYCRNLFSVASMEANGPVDEKLVSEEFNIEAKDFYDEVIKVRDAESGFSSKAFPSLGFYKHEFETDRVSVLYDLFLAYPSPKYAAVLINIARLQPNQPRFDAQERTDARMALAMIHYRLQDKSKSADRWKELVLSTKNEEHYLSKIIWARLLAYGETVPKDVSTSIGYVRETFMYAGQYSERGSRKKMSIRNSGAKANETLYDILNANPQHPYRQFNLSFLQTYDQAARVKDGWPEVKAQLGPGLAEVERTSSAAALKATQILGSAKSAGNIKAQKTSLDSATRTRVSDAPDYNADMQTLASLARELGKIDKLNDEQVKLLVDATKLAHESGDRAISMNAQMIGVTMDVLNRRGMEAMAGVIPFIQRIQSYQDSACSVVSRLDHAAMVKKVVTLEPDRSGLANLMGSD